MKEDFAERFRNQALEQISVSEDESSEFIAPPAPHPKYHKKNRRREKEAARATPVDDSASLVIERSSDAPQDVKFCSRSEAICAELLRRFVPHFDLNPGVTFQVPIGRDGRGNTFAVDFLVDGVLFEYHPVRFFKNKKGCGDFRDREEYKAYTKLYHSLKEDKRGFFHEVMRARLTENYFRRRRAMLDAHPLFRRTELIVATCAEEFYHLIIKRFGKNYPKTAERFVALFDQLQQTLPT